MVASIGKHIIMIKHQERVHQKCIRLFKVYMPLEGIPFLIASTFPVFMPFICLHPSLSSGKRSWAINLARIEGQASIEGWAKGYGPGHDLLGRAIQGPRRLFPDMTGPETSVSRRNLSKDISGLVVTGVSQRRVSEDCPKNWRAPRIVHTNIRCTSCLGG